MKPFHVDFLPPRNAGRAWWRLAALALLAGAGAQLYTLGVLHDEAEGLQALAQQRDARGKRAKDVAVPEALKSELRAVDTASRDLGRDWDALFRALESVEVTGIQLTSIQTDPGSRSLIIHGRASSVDSLTEYGRQLRATQAVTDVHLANHTVRAEGGSHPVEFRFQALWRRESDAGGSPGQPPAQEKKPEIVGLLDD